eukprot:TCONS_00040878-protein
MFKMNSSTIDLSSFTNEQLQNVLAKLIEQEANANGNVLVNPVPETASNQKSELAIDQYVPSSSASVPPSSTSLSSRTGDKSKKLSQKKIDTTEDDIEELLINEVKSYQVIWSTFCKGYKETPKTKEAWTQKILGKKVCMVHWYIVNRLLF